MRALSSCPRVERDSITAVLSARVPVLKFLFRKKDRTTVEIDICVSNVLGVANTQLLAKYASLDERVASLGRTVKAWAKKSRIVGTQDGMSRRAAACGRAELLANFFGGAVWGVFRENANCGDPPG